MKMKAKSPISRKNDHFLKALNGIFRFGVELAEFLSVLEDIESSFFAIIIFIRKF